MWYYLIGKAINYTWITYVNSCEVKNGIDKELAGYVLSTLAV